MSRFKTHHSYLGTVLEKLPDPIPVGEGKTPIGFLDKPLPRPVVLVRR